MAMSLNRRQVERWLKQGLSLRQIAAHLDIPWTTFRRHWHQLQKETSAPVQANVTELPPRPGPPDVDSSPPARVKPSPPQSTRVDSLSCRPYSRICSKSWPGGASASCSGSTQVHLGTPSAGRCMSTALD
jgi:hypothetical protein